jgi:DNA-binding MarR family transcriptional regulator/GNAT superfamily N-acetyltransferase
MMAATHRTAMPLDDPPANSIDDPVAAVRAFNRFYTRQIGLLQQGLLDSRFSLTEARVLYELAHRDRTTATEIGDALGLDAGYLSRILRRFDKDGLIAKSRDTEDGRRSHLALTAAGREAFAGLDAASRREIGAMLDRLDRGDQRRLVGCMNAIEGLLAAPRDGPTPYVLRLHQPGDMGWVIGRHGALYAEEYGWDETFEGFCAEIAAAFLRDFDPRRERCWIAEVDGEPVGSVFLVAQPEGKGKSKTVAKLRLLIVDPKARGLGIGKRLVEECIRFARRVGYKKITLWTNDILHAARGIYEQAGFVLVDEAPHHSFGVDLVGQNWELAL